jgi:threonine dehydratase
MPVSGPSIDEIRLLRSSLGDDIYRTPILRCAGIEDYLGKAARIFAKLEFLQRTGTFKARGALAALRSLSAEQRAAGVTAVSAGNHAIATAFAAAVTGTSAKVVMLASANAMRMDMCRSFGAELVLADDVHSAFEIAEQIERSEGRFFVHPFEGPEIAAGTGTVGLEICEQNHEFDTVIVPIGGGGLIGGMANAIKQLRSDVEVIGVEPVGADSMSRSLTAGEPQAIDKVRTIADSLGAPFALPYSFELCRANVDRIVLIDDDQLREAMGFLFRFMKIAVEPACAASTAALLGPLRNDIQGRSIVLTMCGSNIDWSTFAQQVVFRDFHAG